MMTSKRKKSRAGAPAGFRKGGFSGTGRKPVFTAAGRVAGMVTHETAIANLPALESAQTVAEVADLALEDLDVDRQYYQRDVDDAEVKQIALHFDPLKLGVLTVSARADKKFYLLDGQHRWLALVERGATEVSCEVLRGLTREQEAAIFRARNRERRQLNPYGDFKAAVASGEAAAVRIKHAVTNHGYEVASPNRNSPPNYIMAVDGLRRLDAWGVLDRTLTTIKGAWWETRHATDKPVLLAIGAFWKLHPQATTSDLTLRLTGLPLTNAINEAQQRAASTMEHRTWVQLYKMFLQRYNKGRRKGKLPELSVPPFALRHWTGAGVKRP